AAHIISEAPVAEPPLPAPTPIAAPQPTPPVPEPEVDFSQGAKPANEPRIKHVKMRTSVDVIAELETLPKKAPQVPPKVAKKEVSPLDELLHPRKREVQKSLTLAVAPGTLPKSKSLRLALSFENEDGVVQSQEQTVDLTDAADVKTLSVNLKFE